MYIKRHIDSTIERISGEFPAILLSGARQTGKTTLLKILMELEKPDSGYLRIGYNVNFGYYDQGQLLLDDNETVLGEMKNAYHLYTDTEMRSLLGRFLFTGDDVFKQVSELSGGEKQRIAVARALVNNPAVILADEPSGSLDSRNKQELHQLFFDLRDRFGQTFVIVTHDEQLAATTDRTIHLRDGLIEDSNASDQTDAIVADSDEPTAV